MRAMLLAAGLGERMLPLTAEIPKAALPVLGRPLAVLILRRLARYGVDTAVLNLHHLPDRLRALLGPGAQAGLPTIHYTLEEEILGTAGGIRGAAEFLKGDRPFLAVNSDTLDNIDIEAAVRTHGSSGCAATLVLAPEREEHSVVEVDAEGKVLSLAGRPEADPRRVAGRFLYTGFQILEQEILERIPGDRPSDIVRDVHHELAAEGRLGSHVHDGFWWEFGSPGRYLEGSLRLLRLGRTRREEVAETDPVRELGGAVAAVGPGAEFHNAVELVGSVALGMACYIGEGSCLEDTVVMPEAWVGPGSRLRRCVVAPGVELEGGFEADDALICAGAETAPGPLPPDTERLGDLLVRRL